MNARAIKSPNRTQSRPSARRSAGSTYSRSSYSKANKQQSLTFAETLIFQGIVCGIVLCLALILCVIKTPSAQSVRLSLKSALTNDIEPQTPGENPVLSFAKSINSSVKNLFEKEPKAPAMENPQTTQTISDETVPAFSNQGTETDFRIDEDILESIYNSGGENTEIIEDLSEKKLMVPESQADISEPGN